MAGIDHTIIQFKNGKLVKKPFEIITKDYVVDYNRDAILIKIIDIAEKKEIREFTNIDTDWYTFEERSIYFKPRWLCNLLIKILPKKKVYYSELRHYCKDGLEVISYLRDGVNILIVITKDENYVLVGGYGHHYNPYTHFYGRGYGEEFEKRMAIECYDWVCEDILSEITDCLIQGMSDNSMIKHYQQRLSYKSLYDMNEKEREEYYQLRR